MPSRWMGWIKAVVNVFNRDKPRTLGDLIPREEHVEYVGLSTSEGTKNIDFPTGTQIAAMRKEADRRSQHRIWEERIQVPKK